MSIANRRCIQYPYSSEPDTSEDKEIWYVSVPAIDYIRQAFFGALSRLGEAESYNPISDAAAEYGAEIAASLTQVDPTAGENAGMSSEITLSPLNMAIASGNALARTANSAQLDSTYYFQSPALNLQILRAQRFMAAGDWGYRLVTMKAVDSGILAFKIYLPGVYDALDVTHDFYNATNALNFYFTGTFTLNEPGLHFIDFKTNGKNASSTAYLQRFTILEMWRTADL